MALIKCTECGKEFSNYAVACPNCGCPTSIVVGEIEQDKGDTAIQGIKTYEEFKREYDEDWNQIKEILNDDQYKKAVELNKECRRLKNVLLQAEQQVRANSKNAREQRKMEEEIVQPKREAYNDCLSIVHMREADLRVSGRNFDIHYDPENDYEENYYETCLYSCIRRELEKLFINTAKIDVDMVKEHFRIKDKEFYLDVNLPVILENGRVYFIKQESILKESTNTTNQEPKKQDDASVIKRGVVGAVIAGPMGAVIGAASALDKNIKKRS